MNAIVESKNTATVVKTQSIHPGQMIEMLIEKPDFDPDKLIKLFELQERYDAKVAREAYYKAMTRFSSIVPQITYDSMVSYGTTNFAFASLAGILSKIQEAMGQCELQASWKTNSDNNIISVTCIITHELGHSEETTLSAIADTSGGKNSIQAVKSTVSYLRRITLEAMLGLAAKGEDDDGQGATEYVTEEQAANIQALFDEVGGAKDKFLLNFKADSFETIPADQFQRAIKLLEEKRKA